MTTTPTEKVDDAPAEFNNALAFLERLNNIEITFTNTMMAWDLKRAFEILDIYEAELSFTYQKDEESKVKALKKGVDAYFIQYPFMGRPFQDKAGNKRITNADVTPIVRDKLLELYKYLRGVKQRSGMGMPKKGEGKLF